MMFLNIESVWDTLKKERLTDGSLEQIWVQLLSHWWTPRSLLLIDAAVSDGAAGQSLQERNKPRAAERWFMRSFCLDCKAASFSGNTHTLFQTLPVCVDWIGFSCQFVFILQAEFIVLLRIQSSLIKEQKFPEVSHRVKRSPDLKGDGSETHSHFLLENTMRRCTEISVGVFGVWIWLA